MSAVIYLSADILLLMNLLEAHAATAKSGQKETVSITHYKELASSIQFEGCAMDAIAD